MYLLQNKSNWVLFEIEIDKDFAIYIIKNETQKVNKIKMYLR